MEKDQKYIVFIGAPGIDEYYDVPAGWPHMGDKALVQFGGLVAGGMVANAACVCAGYGVKTYCFDAMGKEDMSQFLIKDMQDNGVNMSYIVQLDDFYETKCLIFQTSGERTIFVSPGSKCKHTLTDAEWAFLRGASYLFTSPTYLHFIDDYEGMLKDLKAHGVNIVVDSEANTIRPGWENSLQYAHTLFFNEFSVEVFAEGAAEDVFFQKLFGMGITNIVITLGPHGCRVVTKDDDFSIPAYDVPKVDTTGAGDTFNSSFTVGMLKGWPIRETAFFANAAANMAIGVQGPRGGVGTEERVRAFIAERAGEIAPIY